MPRTPIFSALVRLARTSAEASAAHADGSRSSSRRAFVAGIATLPAAAMLLHQPNRATAATGSRVAIVGAGISGLTAALSLH